MEKKARLAASLVACALIGSIHAQETPRVGVETSSVAPASGFLPAGTEVHLQMVDDVASNTHKRGDHFNLTVVDPVIVGGREWIPAGAPAVGEVIEAHKSSGGGSPGRLILAARFVIANNSKIALRSFTAGAGQDRSRESMAVGTVIGPFGFFVTGKNMIVPKGTHVIAKVATDASASTQIVNDKQETQDGPQDKSK